MLEKAKSNFWADASVAADDEDDEDLCLWSLKIFSLIISARNCVVCMFVNNEIETEKLTRGCLFAENVRNNDDASGLCRRREGVGSDVGVITVRF